ncbi:MAG: radical SAM protein [Calditrichaeota bacterium]|nr:radical SAM protein [Calditrichota bacterium]
MLKNKWSHLPYLVVSNAEGKLFEIPELRMTGMALDQFQLPGADELIPLPEGSDLFELPGRTAIGFQPESDELVALDEYQGEPVFAAAAFMAPAYVQFLRASFLKKENAPRLPLYAYTAVGWKDGKFFVSGTRIDPDERQDFRHVDLGAIDKAALKMAKKFPRNRLVQHLIENCVFKYGCPAARNFVMQRWEAPIPTSPACNANCVGCISFQPKNTTVTAAQNRLNFVPAPEEIAEFVVPHLEKAPRAVASFGQGCEGEPLLVGDLLEEAIKKIRQRTAKGIINLNTNASLPGVIEKLFRAGLDSVRVSMNSAQKLFYDRYYRPNNYTFDDVLTSIEIARKFNRFISLNYFVFPGFTDHPDEISALKEIISKYKINLIQARNLNMDPDWYTETLQLNRLSPDFIGIKNWLSNLREDFPFLRFGYFNPPEKIVSESLKLILNS